MKNLFTIIGTLVLLSACTGTPTDMDDKDMPMDDAMHNEEVGAMDDMDHDDSMMDSRVIEIEASDWSFTPDTITAKKGERVTLKITSVTGDHGFGVKELDINAKVDEGQTVTIDLPTSTPGTYTVYCSVPCGPGHKDMLATIVITE